MIRMVVMLAATFLSACISQSVNMNSDENCVTTKALLMTSITCSNADANSSQTNVEQARNLPK